MISVLKNRFVLCRNSKDLPSSYGLYFIFKKDDTKNINPVYIGSATGKDGLFGRIHNQHLKINYLTEKGTKEKSSFRKSIGIEYNKKPGKETVDFIIEQFKIYTVEGKKTDYLFNIVEGELPRLGPILKKKKELDTLFSNEILKGVILAFESIMIKDLNPRYNKNGK